jgi:toxin FitB
MTDAILLDTNVVSELMKQMPDQRVLVWFELHKDAVFVVSAITRAEIHLGIQMLPDGKRKEGLAAAATRMFMEDFTACLPFDAAGADLYAGLVGERMRQGLPISTEDGQIVAIALANQMPLATRNTKDFANISGLSVLNPWE